MHQVRYFLAVGETLNFTRAAEFCHVAQPSLTRAIKKLEDELGGPLFCREQRNTHLTELGKMMLVHMRSIHASNAAAVAEARRYGTLDRASLKLGVMGTIGPTLLVGFFERLRARVPALDLLLHDAPAEHLIAALDRGDIDVALVALPTYPERCIARPLFRERYTIAFAGGHRFEPMSTVPLGELDGEDYVQRIHCEFRHHFEALGLPPWEGANVRYRTEREDWIQAMVLAGLGCAVVPEFLPLLPGLATRPIVQPEIARTIHLVSVAGRRFTPVQQVFMRLAQAYRWETLRQSGLPSRHVDVAQNAPVG